MNNKISMCEKITYELKLLWLKLYHIYDNYQNPLCTERVPSVGVKKSS